MKLPSTLLGRTNAVLGVSAAAIALTSIVALATFVVLPIEDRSAHDEAGLIVLAAQTWVNLPAEARHFFEIELLAEHDMVVTADVRALPQASGSRLVRQLEAKLSQPSWRTRAGDGQRRPAVGQRAHGRLCAAGGRIAPSVKTCSRYMWAS